MSLRKGCWWIRSKKDKRWNCDGNSDLVGGFVIPEECKKTIEKLKLKYGDPPEDLTWEYMKD
jgi:hypothetical protein